MFTKDQGLENVGLRMDEKFRVESTVGEPLRKGLGGFSQLVKYSKIIDVLSVT